MQYSRPILPILFVFLFSVFGLCTLTTERSYFESVLSNQFCNRLVIRAAIVYCTIK